MDFYEVVGQVLKLLQVMPCYGKDVCRIVP